MLKNYHVDVGDAEAIAEAIDKQKVCSFCLNSNWTFLQLFFFPSTCISQSVVRELDYKKPQLDELVQMAENLKTDANKQQLHNKGNFCWIFSILKIFFLRFGGFLTNKYHYHHQFLLIGITMNLIHIGNCWFYKNDGFIKWHHPI